MHCRELRLCYIYAILPKCLACRNLPQQGSNIQKKATNAWRKQYRGNGPEHRKQTSLAVGKGRTRSATVYRALSSSVSARWPSGPRVVSALWPGSCRRYGSPCTVCSLLSRLTACWTETSCLPGGLSLSLSCRMCCVSPNLALFPFRFSPSTCSQGYL